MSQESIERFLGRVLTDDDFRLAAKKSLKSVCADSGLKFTHEEIEALATLDWAKLEPVTALIDKTIKRSSRPKAMTFMDFSIASS